MLCADTIFLLQETIKQQNQQTTFRIVDETTELEKIITIKIKKDNNKKNEQDWIKQKISHGMEWLCPSHVAETFPFFVVWPFTHNNNADAHHDIDDADFQHH